MKVTIIANGFQEDYTEHLLNNMVGKVENIDFIGSSIHLDRKIDPSIRFLNFRGDHAENVPKTQKLLRVLKYHFLLMMYILKSRIRIVHVLFVRFPVIEGILFTWFMRLTGKKVIYTAHDVMPHSQDTLYNRMVFKWLYKAPNKIIVHTNYIKNRIVSEFHIAPEKITAVPHGVYEKEQNAAITREVARRIMGLPGDKIILLFFGIIAEYKGFDILLNSLKFLKNPERIRILIAGKISIEYKTLFEKIIGDTGIKHYLIPMLRYIKDEEIESVFKASDITVLPYKEASQSGVLFMSYTYGIPVLVPNLGGFPDDVLPGKTGYIFEKNNAESLAEKIDLFTKSKDQSDVEMSPFIRSYALDHYSWDKSCLQMRELYLNA
jgi:glycosyltransferase involved in cell wall biosynthesis